MILDGKKPFEFRKNDRGYKVGDRVIHNEFDPVKNEETGRTCYVEIIYVIDSQFGIPEGFCIFTQHTIHQQDFIRDFHDIQNRILPAYESKLNHKRGGTVFERLDHTLSSFENSATQSIWKAKNFLEDVKAQFKALEIITEGMTSEGMNHGQKRVIANHLIGMLRDMVDRIGRIDWEYSNGMYDRYNFFRSESPEGNIMKKLRDAQDENQRLRHTLQSINQKLPEDERKDLPF